MRQKSIYKSVNAELMKKHGEKKKPNIIFRVIKNITTFFVLIMFCSLGYIYVNSDTITVETDVTKPKMSEVEAMTGLSISNPLKSKEKYEEFGLGIIKWNPNQVKNIMTVYKAAKDIGHPSPKRMVAHLIAESSGRSVKDGDIVNGAFKKSYGIMQVKLGTVYYARSKRPDLIKIHTPEVNKLPKEDILHMLRTDEEFNAKIAVITHMGLIKVCGNQDRATVAYNRGFCKPDKQGQDYLNKILKHESKFTIEGK